MNFMSDFERIAIFATFIFIILAIYPIARINMKKEE